MDLSTALTILGGAIGSKELLAKLLGPTSEYLGDELKTSTQKRLKNLNRVFEKFQKSLGTKIEDSAAVPPRVLKGILNEGFFCDDELMADYFGGVLASSRTGTSRDDRGVSFIALISRLTTYQIRSHFVFYQTFKTFFNNRTDCYLTQSSIRSTLGLYIPFESFKQSLDLVDGEDFHQLLPHIMFGLGREELFERFRYGTNEETKRLGGEGIIFHPSVLGTELFLWAHGKGDLSVNKFLDAETEIPNDTGIEIPNDVKSIAAEEEKKRAEEKKAADIARRLKPEF
ncbi:MAG TPA: hypothetical protein VGO50_13475 [Pyrinomonadaceae bacterium]|jgi:hypothetical protein|nr:hypothetical protein [Pyrinomonadaceae bacterium]